MVTAWLATRRPAEARILEPLFDTIMGVVSLWLESLSEYSRLLNVYAMQAFEFVRHECTPVVLCCEVNYAEMTCTLLGSLLQSSELNNEVRDARAPLTSCSELIVNPGL